MAAATKIEPLSREYCGVDLMQVFLSTTFVLPGIRRSGLRPDLTMVFAKTALLSYNTIPVGQIDWRRTMTTVAKSTRLDTMFLPEKLFNLLKLREGDVVKIVVEGHTLRVSRLEAFLNLRGALADDEAFDCAMAEIDQGWNEWTLGSRTC
jgi:antitoxin component of MazEF toxin-antitoxin module